MTKPLAFKAHRSAILRHPVLRRALSVAILWILLLQPAAPSLMASPQNAIAPMLSSVFPAQAYNDQTTTLSIAGANFVYTPAVLLGNSPLSHVTFIDSSRLTATVPAELPGGVYTMTLTNPDSQSASLPNAFTVVVSGNGNLSSWEAVADMTTARYAQAVVQAADNLYALGGYDLNTHPLASVERATIGSDGSLGPWQATSPLTETRFFLSAAQSNGYIYVIGGIASQGTMRDVERAAIQPNGSLGIWQTTSLLNTERMAAASVAANGHLYVMGGGAYTTTVEFAAINGDGSLSAWSYAPSMNTLRGYLSAVVVGNYLYAIGGQNSVSASLRSVERAIIAADGTLSAWQIVSPMVKPRCDFAAAAAGGYIYAIGGSTCTLSGPYNSVERALVHSDGSLGAWELSAATMTTPRWHQSAAVRSPYLYAIGGLDDGNTPLASVEKTALNRTLKLFLPFVMR